MKSINEYIIVDGTPTTFKEFLHVNTAEDVGDLDISDIFHVLNLQPGDAIHVGMVEVQRFKPIGGLTETNFGGIELMFNHSNDGVFYRFNWGQENIEQEQIYAAEILYDEQEGYFLHPSRSGDPVKYHLNEFMAYGTH